jgi:hypothetical protein
MNGVVCRDERHSQIGLVWLLSDLLETFRVLGHSYKKKKLPIMFFLCAIHTIFNRLTLCTLNSTKLMGGVGTAMLISMKHAGCPGQLAGPHQALWTDGGSIDRPLSPYSDCFIGGEGGRGCIPP